MYRLRESRTTQPIELPPVRDIVDTGKVLEEGHVLRHIADLTLDVVREAMRVAPQDLHRATIGFQESQDEVDGGRLTGTVRAKQPEQVTLADLEIHSLHSSGLLERLSQTPGLDDSPGSMTFSMGLGPELGNRDAFVVTLTHSHRCSPSNAEQHKGWVGTGMRARRPLTV